MGKVLHASESGFFPFCINPSIEFPEIQVPLLDAMEFYWRIKRYKFSMPASSFTVSGDSLPSVVVFSCVAVNDIVSSNLFASTEEDIVCGFGGGSLMSVVLPFIQTVDGESFDATSSFGVFPQIVSQGNIVTPPETVGLNVFTQADGGYFFIADSAPSFAQCGTLTVKITNTLKYNFKIFFALSLVSVSGSINILLEPNEYWSYGETYDTTTGLPL